MAAAQRRDALIGVERDARRGVRRARRHDAGVLRVPRTPPASPARARPRPTATRAADALGAAQAPVAQRRAAAIAAARAGRTASSRSALRLTLPVPVALGVFALWLALAAYALVRLAIGLDSPGTAQARRAAAAGRISRRDAAVAARQKGARDVRLCVSDETDVPVAVGLFDAMILVPRSLLERLSEPEVDQICLHELAHLRRADDWTNGLQRVVSALLGWNPAAQFVGQQLDLEREVACDDWVLSFVGTVRPYALCLTKMAETRVVAAPARFRRPASLRRANTSRCASSVCSARAATSRRICRSAPAAAAVAIVGAIALAIAVVAPSVAAPLAVVAATPASAATAAAHATPAATVKKRRSRRCHRRAGGAATVAAAASQPAAHAADARRERPYPAETAAARTGVPKLTIARVHVDTNRLSDMITKSVAANVDAAARRVERRAERPVRAPDAISAASTGRGATCTA